MLPSHRLYELDVADLGEVGVMSACSERDLLRGVRVVGRDVGVDRDLLRVGDTGTGKDRSVQYSDRN